MSRKSEGDRGQQNKSIYELNVKMIKNAEKGKNKMRRRAARRSSGRAAMSSPLISRGSVAWGTEWADCGCNNGYHSPRQQMLILIRADLFVTQRERHTHTSADQEEAARRLDGSTQSRPRKKKTPRLFLRDTWRWRQMSSQLVGVESGTGGRGSRVGAAQHDCRSLRRPAVGHSHAFSVLCNQAAC